MERETQLLDSNILARFDSQAVTSLPRVGLGLGRGTGAGLTLSFSSGVLELPLLGIWGESLPGSSRGLLGRAGLDLVEPSSPSFCEWVGM